MTTPTNKPKVMTDEELLDKWLVGKDYLWTDGGCLSVNDNPDGFLNLISKARAAGREEATHKESLLHPTVKNSLRVPDGGRNVIEFVEDWKRRCEKLGWSPESNLSLEMLVINAKEEGAAEQREKDFNICIGTQQVDENGYALDEEYNYACTACAIAIRQQADDTKEGEGR